MGGTTNVVKGRIKEAAGALIGNDKLRAEGQVDQAVGNAEQAAQEAAAKVAKAAAEATEKAKQSVCKACE